MNLFNNILAGKIHHKWRVQCHNEHNIAVFFLVYCVLFYERNFNDDNFINQYPLLNASDKISSNSPRENYDDWARPFIRMSK